MADHTQSPPATTRVAEAVRRASVRASLKKVASRFGLILSGELIQSLFHFVLNIVLVRELSAHDYGLFAIVFAIGAVGITYVRALVAVPATLLLTRSHGRPAARGYNVMFGSGGAVVSALMAAFVTVALVPVIGLGAIAGGAFVGLYAFRSYLRIVLVARGQSRIASLSDIVFAGSGFALIGLSVHGEGIALLDQALAFTALAHALGIAVAFGVLRERLRFSLHAQTRKRYRAIWRPLAWSLAGVTSVNVQGQGLALLLAFAIGPASYAPIAATLVLYAPLRIAAIAMINMLLPAISRLLADRETGSAKRIAARVTLAAGGICLAYGTLMLMALPAIEEVLFKGRFADEPMGWIGFATWSAVTLALLYAVPRTFLEASAAFRTITEVALVSALLGFAIMVPILAWLPSAYALLGLTASEALTLLLSVQAFRQRVSSSYNGVAGPLGR
jgi:O-antigen/teichoic acid export membrane protein